LIDVGGDSPEFLQHLIKVLPAGDGEQCFEDRARTTVPNVLGEALSLKRTFSNAAI
jgi:hypothetical protein